jgi:hypothetical protein
LGRRDAFLAVCVVVLLVETVIRAGKPTVHGESEAIVKAQAMDANKVFWREWYRGMDDGCDIYAGRATLLSRGNATAVLSDLAGYLAKLH